MKLQDYGKGKPLTARRILAVKDAIDSVNAAVNSVTDTSSQANEKTNALIQQGKEKIHANNALLWGCRARKQQGRRNLWHNESC